MKLVQVVLDELVIAEVCLLESGSRQVWEF